MSIIPWRKTWLCIRRTAWTHGRRPSPTARGTPPKIFPPPSSSNGRLRIPSSGRRPSRTSSNRKTSRSTRKSSPRWRRRWPSSDPMPISPTVSITRALPKCTRPPSSTSGPSSTAPMTKAVSTRCPKRRSGSISTTISSATRSSNSSSSTPPTSRSTTMSSRITATAWPNIWLNLKSWA